MEDKKVQGAREHTFLENGKIVYDMISEERIREIIREEIEKYNEVFMSKAPPTFDVDMSMEDHGPGPDEDEWSSTAKNKRTEYIKRWIQK